jgi:UDP:flavonoid glycosyltransferase YjiC (YdhE family)
VHTIANWWHSPHCILGLFPDWFAPPQADWPPNVHLTGFPLFDEAEHVELSGAVEQFLNAGTPPIVFTAGSAMRHGHDFFSAAADACVRLDKRGILLARFSEQIPTGLPTTVRHFDYVPFSLLLRRAAALVHHGGIGTTAQALAAGLPQLIMPLAHDQPDNAMRLKRLGVGESLTRGKFKGPAVAQRLRALLSDPDLPARCRVLADRINRDHALARSCEVIEGLLADAPRPSPVS